MVNRGSVFLDTMDIVYRDNLYTTSRRTALSNAYECAISVKPKNYQMYSRTVRESKE